MTLEHDVEEWIRDHLQTPEKYESIHLDQLPSRPSREAMWHELTLNNIFEAGCRLVSRGSRPDLRFLLVLLLAQRVRLWIDPPETLTPYLRRAHDLEPPGIYLETGSISRPHQEAHRFPLKVGMQGLGPTDYQVFFRQYRDSDNIARGEPYEQVIFFEQLRPAGHDASRSGRVS